MNLISSRRLTISFLSWYYLFVLEDLHFISFASWILLPLIIISLSNFKYFISRCILWDHNAELVLIFFRWLNLISNQVWQLRTIQRVGWMMASGQILWESMRLWGRGLVFGRNLQSNIFRVLKDIKYWFLRTHCWLLYIIGVVKRIPFMWFVLVHRRIFTLRCKIEIKRNFGLMLPIFLWDTLQMVLPEIVLWSKGFNSLPTLFVFPRQWFLVFLNKFFTVLDKESSLWLVFIRILSKSCRRIVWEFVVNLINWMESASTGLGLGSFGHWLQLGWVSKILVDVYATIHLIDVNVTLWKKYFWIWMPLCKRSLPFPLNECVSWSNWFLWRRARFIIYQFSFLHGWGLRLLVIDRFL